MKTYDERVAERVLVNTRPPTQMLKTPEHEALLTVPKELWLKHKTDIAYVKSTQPVHIKPKKGSQCHTKHCIHLSSMPLKALSLRLKVC